MTYSPKSELVGVLSPSSIKTRDIGVIWTNSLVTGSNIITSVSLGNGISIIGTANGHVWRSTDYGKAWTDLGVVSTTSIQSSVYLGSGIVLIGDAIGHEFRSTDFGINWTDIGDVAVSNSILSLSNLGNGKVILTTASGGLTGRIRLSANYGLTWATVFGTLNQDYVSSCYLENGIVLVGRSDGNIIRSNNYGASLSWTDLGNVLSGFLYLAYLGNGVAVATGSVFLSPTIFRSTDYGLTWPTSTSVGFGDIFRTATYVGNGIVIFTTAFTGIYRSNNYGLTVEFISGLAAIMGTASYLGNGVIIIGDASGNIFRSDVAYKLDEAEVLIDSSLITTTTSMTLGQSHNMVNVDCSAAPVTITLPVPSTLQNGHEFIIKNIAVSTWKVTIDPGATTIDGYSTPRTLSDLEQSLKIRTDGVRYFINSEYQNFTLGQLKPPIERWTMPGWLVTRGDIGFALVANRTYYIPFFVASTTGFLKVSVDVTSAGAASAMALVVYTWNDGLPGMLVSLLGSVSVTTTGAKTIDLPPLILHRGFYFMGMMGGPAAFGLRAINFSYADSAPVGAMSVSNTTFGLPPVTSTNNYLNSYVMFTDAGLSSPARVPTGIQNDCPIFLLREN